VANNDRDVLTATNKYYTSTATHHDRNENGVRRKAAASRYIEYLTRRRETNEPAKMESTKSFVHSFATHYIYQAHIIQMGLYYSTITINQYIS
jgi:hypothetical protein